MREYIKIRETLTNEALRGVFKNNFDLTNQAIRLARFYIRSGHEIHLGKLLNELKRNPSEQYIKDLQKMEDEDEEESNYEA